MTLRENTAIVSAVLVIVGTSRYIYLALSNKKVRLVPAAWIVNGVATMLSFATYWTTPDHSIVSNAYNAIAAVSINAILAASLIIVRREKRGFGFSPFHRKCLWASLFITAIWMVTVWGLGGTGIISNILTQVMMLIGYFVIAEKLWRATVNTESLFVWWCIVLASLAGTVTAAISHDWLASIFAGRTLFCSSIIVLLIGRIERRSRSATADQRIP